MKKKQCEGQMSLSDLPNQLQIDWSCSKCVCKSCLYWWSDRCPYGLCYDDLRAKDNPYDKAHLDKPPRKIWSNWNKPGEQAHWCRGGSFYPSHWCWHYVRYEGQQVRTCLEYNVSVFQDGYIRCGFLPGCEECYRRFEERMENE